MRRQGQSDPGGWQTSLLDNVTVRGSGHTPDKEVKDYWDGGIKWVSLADSSRLDAGYIFQTDKEISELGLAKSSAVLHPPGTVVMSRDAGVGKSAILSEAMAVSQHFMAWRCSPELGLDSWFLYYWLQSHKREFERQAVGSTIKTIGLPYFKRLMISHPPLSEQRRIAEIISAWERAINVVEALIANAREQKAALIQELLAGRIRLPGFSGQWITTSIGAVCDQVTERAGEEVKLPVLSCSKHDGFVESLKYFKKKVFSDDLSAYKVVRRGMIAFPTNHVEEGSIALQDVVDAGLVSPIYCVFRPVTVDGQFLIRLLKTNAFTQHFAAATNASVDRRGSLRWKEFSQLRLELPPLNEQQAIAQMINAAENIERMLTNQRDALGQQKGGLMQQLLTGRRRVKLAESEAA